MDSETVLFRNDDLRRCFSMFKNMRQQRELCDVTFQTESTTITAHRVVIAASIPYFRDSFFGEEEEAAVATIEPGIFECFVEYAYSHEIRINAENVRDLLSGSCHFRVKEVKEACCNFLSDRLQPESVISLRDMACRLCCWDLLDDINRYIRENFVAVSQTKDFLNVPFLYIKELIGRDDLLVSNEEKVFEAVMKWTEESPEERQTNLPELLRRVRMPLLELEYLTDKAEQEELIRTSIPCRDLVDEAKNYHLFRNRNQRVPSFSSVPRCWKQQTVAKSNNGTIYNLAIFNTYIIERFGDDKKKWTTIYNGTTDKNACAFAAQGDKMYYFYDGKAVQYSHKDKIQYLKSMSSPRGFAAAVSFKNKIIVCGGSIENTAQNTVESLDPHKNEWVSLRSMRRHRAGPSAVTLCDCIYVLGGTDYTSVHDSVERYDSETGKWCIVSRMLTKRCIASAATIKGKIYVCGGDTSPIAGVVNCTATAEMYDPNQNAWYFISPMKMARCQIIGLEHRGKLYILGGSESDGKGLSAVEIYDPENDTWEFGQAPEHKEHFLSGAVVM